MASRTLRTFQVASRAVGAVPLPTLLGLAERAGSAVGPRLMPDKTAMLARHIGRVDPSLDAAERRSAAARGLGSYGRYWAESFRLPGLSARTVDHGFSVTGYENIHRALGDGVGPILVLPHLGGWEWAAAWLSRVMGLRVTAVAERLEPHDVFQWFVDLRASYGIDVIPLGPEAMGGLVKAVKRRDVVCLLSDRDLTGSGIEVEFLGESTTLPAGPALLARRTGAPLLPTAVYLRDHDHLAVVGGPIRADDGVKLRTDMARVTQELADALGHLITAGPDQWHLLEPNWPSDPDLGTERPAPGPEL